MDLTRLQHLLTEAFKTAAAETIFERKKAASPVLPISSDSNHPFPGIREVKRTRYIGSQNPGKRAFMRVNGQIER